MDENSDTQKINYEVLAIRYSNERWVIKLKIIYKLLFVKCS